MSEAAGEEGRKEAEDEVRTEADSKEEGSQWRPPEEKQEEEEDAAAG